MAWNDDVDGITGERTRVVYINQKNTGKSVVKTPKNKWFPVFLMLLFITFTAVFCLMLFSNKKTNASRSIMLYDKFHQTAVADGEWIYYTNTADGNTLYKAGIGNGEVFKLNEDSSWFISVSGDWIYYSNENDGGCIYKIRTDGGMRKKVNDDESGYITVSGEWIYYINTGEGGTICKIRTDGSMETKLNNNKSYNLKVYSDWIYYVDGTIDGHVNPVFRMRTDGSDKVAVNSDDSCYMSIWDGWIYYANQYDNCRIYRMKTDGTEKTRLNDDRSYNICVDDNWIYYTNENDGSRIYKIGLDGGSSIKVSDLGAEYICSAGDWLFFPGASNVLNRINKDGSGRTALDEKGAGMPAESTSNLVDVDTVLDLYYFTYDESLKEGIKTVTDTVTALNPKITFILQEEPDYGNYSIKVDIMVAAGETPDIYGAYTYMMSDLVSRGEIRDLTDESFMAGVLSAAADVMKTGGRVYGLPLSWDAAGIIYNKDIFEKFNITVPDTYTEFMEVCGQLKANGISPFARGFKDSWVRRIEFDNDFCVALRNIPDFYSMTGSGTGKIADFQEFKASLERYAQKARFTDTTDFECDFGQAISKFADGNAGMMIEGTWIINQIMKENPEFNPGFFPNPVSDEPAGNLMLVNGGYGFMASTGSDSMDAVKEVFEYITSEEGARNWVNTAGSIPSAEVEPSSLNFQCAAMTDAYQTAFDGKAFYVDLYNIDSVWKDNYEYFSDILKELAMGSITPDTAISRLDEKLGE